MQASLSVVIPAYNCAAYIGGALRSVIAQSLSPNEIIVVDDSSGDDTATVVRDVAPQALYLRNKCNEGAAAARNCGAEVATCEYIAFLDADDEWFPWKLDMQLRVLRNNPLAVAVGGAMVPFGCSIPSPPEMEPQTDIFTLEDMLMRNHLATPTVVVRASAFRRVGGFDPQLTICEDYDLWLRLAGLGPVACVNYPVARYRVRADGVSAGNRQLTRTRHDEYVRTLPRRFSHVAGVSRRTKINLAHVALEDSIEQTDAEANAVAGLASLIRSYWHWPRALPTANTPLLRARRLVHTLRQLTRRAVTRHEV